MSTPESKVRDPVVKWAKAHGFLHFRMSFRPGVRQGVPDDLFVSKYGDHIWIEFKAPGKHPTPLQQARINALRARGVRAYWSDDSVYAVAELRDG